MASPQAPPPTTTANSALDDEIAEFFTQTSVSRSSCDALVAELFPDSSPSPSSTQGQCSYTIFANDKVVQFRLKSLPLPITTSSQAREVYGSYAPEVQFERQLGDDEDKEPLFVYTMSRIEGIPHIEYILAHGFPRDAPELLARRTALARDLARFFARAWPASPSSYHLAALEASYAADLALLHASLPARFRPVIAGLQSSLPTIMRSLPIVLTHNDVSQFNVHVFDGKADEKGKELGRLAGVVDWAEATPAPFGTNLHALEHFIADLHLRNGWIRHPDYDSVVRLFWDTLGETIPEDMVPLIKQARAIGLLRSVGFTCRLANEKEPPRPVRDDESGRYALMILDGLLINLDTRWG